MKYSIILFLLFSVNIYTQTNQKIYDIIDDAVSADRIEKDIETLANFGTRNTFSDTISSTRGIGAARRWIKSEFETISKDCKNCLEVFYQKDFVTKEGNRRVPHDAWIVNVVAIQKGTKYPNRYKVCQYLGQFQISGTQQSTEKLDYLILCRDGLEQAWQR